MYNPEIEQKIRKKILVFKIIAIQFGTANSHNPK